MDFGKILDQWEKKKEPSQSKRSLEHLYDTYIPEEQDIYRDEEDALREDAKSRKPEAVLDLHGETAEETRRKVLDFLHESALSGKRKVLIVHGKGHHSQGEPVLKKIVRQCLEISPYAGKHGHPKREEGGTGAVWVVIKNGRGSQRSR